MRVSIILKRKIGLSIPCMHLAHSQDGGITAANLVLANAEPGSFFFCASMPCSCCTSRAFRSSADQFGGSLELKKSCHRSVLDSCPKI